MKGIQLKINGIWVNLPEDFSLDFDQTSFLFNEQGTYSYPFELPLSANRELVKNIADPHGEIHLSQLDYADAEFWFDDMLLYKGMIRTDDETEIEETLPFTFLSGGSDFESRIEGLNMRDVPLDRDVKLGYWVETASALYKARDWFIGLEFKMPENIGMNFTEYNVAEPYPAKTFCNVRVCGYDEYGNPKVLEAKRPFSGVCFYVRYFLDCLFKHLNIKLDSSALDAYEDFNRLAFFTTQCKVEKKGDPYDVPLSALRLDDFCGSEFSINQKMSYHNDAIQHEFKTEDFKFKGSDVYASNKNLPDKTVSELIKDLRSAFGICLYCNPYTGNVSFYLIKTAFESQDVIDMPVSILELNLVRNRQRKVTVTYGVDDDTAFKYNDYTNLVECADYDQILGKGTNVERPSGERDGVRKRHQRQTETFSPTDTNCYLDKKTGNAYRVKVQKETGTRPALFEVGGFNDFSFGDIEKKEGEEIKIGFTPVINNDVTVFTNEDKSHSMVMAVFADVELKHCGDYYDEDIKTEIISAHCSDGGSGRPPKVEDTHFHTKCPESYDASQGGERPLSRFDAGYTMGIMRGPGNDAKLEYTYENYDGEGNSSFEFVESSYAFTADSCNNHGLFYDYNGTETGGAEQDGRFSLKLTARKFDKEGKPMPIDVKYENRGLVSKFLSEYLYFLTNKKTIVLHVDMTLSQIISIDYTKRYRFGDYIGFINKISYTLTMDSIHNVRVELFSL